MTIGTAAGGNNDEFLLGGNPEGLPHLLSRLERPLTGNVPAVMGSMTRRGKAICFLSIENFAFPVNQNAVIVLGDRLVGPVLCPDTSDDVLRVQNVS